MKDKFHVLIVDDEEEFRLLFSMAIQIAGYACTVAKDTAEALLVLLTKPIDLVITDYNMGRTSGVHLLNQMRAMPNLERIPVILASSDIKIAEIAAAHKFDGAIVKGQLLHSITSVIEDVRRNKTK